MNADLAVVGIGNALVDVLVETGAEVIAEVGVPKGSMALMSLPEAERIHARVGDGLERSGGSAANTMAGLASLGCATGFIGKIADDRLGHVFAHDIGSLGVVFGGGRSRDVGTGRCLILVTPDADRTMCTSLGAAAELEADDVDVALVERGAVTYLEGYLFDLAPAKEAFRLAISVAHRAGRRVAMSLSDPFCVTRHHDDFASLVASDLDLLFANADEICELAGVDDVDQACARLRRPGLTVTVTMGAAGAVAFADDGPVVRAPAVEVDRVVDTTGAGDLYAAGFLCGWTRGWGLDRCAGLGAIAAAEIISHLGARPEVDLAELAGPALSH
jgi:sugar/nucleoside kinase (ribokinase family)